MKDELHLNERSSENEVTHLISSIYLSLSWPAVVLNAGGEIMCSSDIEQACTSK